MGALALIESLAIAVLLALLFRDQRSLRDSSAINQMLADECRIWKEKHQSLVDDLKKLASRGPQTVEPEKVKKVSSAAELRRLTQKENAKE